MFGIDGLSDPDIWKIGRKVFEKPLREGQSIKGRADIETERVAKFGLAFDDSAKGRHTNIVNWPSDNKKWLMKAMKLADASKWTKCSGPDCKK